MFRRNGAPRRALIIAGVAVATAIALAGCAGSPAAEKAGSGSSKASGKTTDVTVTLNFLAWAPNSGFIVAKQKGYYREEGLNVTIQEGQGSNTTAALVASGKSQFGYADGPSEISVAAQGGDLLNIGPVLLTNGFSMMALTSSGIKTIKDLKGKTVGVQPGTAQTTLFDAVLAAAGLNDSQVNIVNLDPSALVASLIQGKVDAITAGADTQAVQLKDQGADINQVLYKDAGVPTIGLSMITQASYAKAHPDVVRRFVAASLKGWSWAVRHQSDTADIVAQQFPQGAVASSIKEQFAVDAKLICPSSSAKVGNVPASYWSKTYKLMVKYLQLPSDKPMSTYYSTAYLPKKLPPC